MNVLFLFQGTSYRKRGSGCGQPAILNLLLSNLENTNTSTLKFVVTPPMTLLVVLMPILLSPLCP